MAIFTTSSSTFSGTMAALSNEAEALLEKAKAYRKQMDELAADDPRREVYDKLIRELLAASNNIASKVKTSVGSS